MKIHSLSTHHYTDGGTGEVFESTKHFWSLKSKQCCGKIQDNKPRHLDKLDSESLHPVLSLKGHLKEDPYLLEDTTGAVWRHVVFFLLFYYVWRSGHQLLQL